MFTGIIQAVGEVAAIEQTGGDVKLRIETGALPLEDVQLGDSILLRVEVLAHSSSLLLDDLLQSLLTCVDNIFNKESLDESLAGLVTLLKAVIEDSSEVLLQLFDLRFLSS